MFAAELTGIPAQPLWEAPRFPPKEHLSLERSEPSKRSGVVAVLCALLAAVAIYAAVYTVVVHLTMVAFTALLGHDSHLVLFEIDAGVLVCAALLSCAALRVQAVRGRVARRPIPLGRAAADVGPRRPFPLLEIETSR